MSKRKLIFAAAAVVVAVYAVGTATYVPEGQEGQLTGVVEFNPATAAVEFWEGYSDQYFKDNAVDLLELLKEANGDLSSVASKYGHYSMGDHGELSFIVKSAGTVDVVKNKLRSGYITVIPDGYSGDTQFRLQIGTVYKGSAVRDSISLLNYKDYKNQIEWAQISQALHELIQKSVIDPIDMNSIAGKHVSFTGCFTVGSPSQIVITPVALKLD